MRRIAALLPPRQRGAYGRRGAAAEVLAGLATGRTPVRYCGGAWEPSPTSESRSAPASATASARRSTRPRRRAPPARRRTPSARSSTTRASSATSRRSASGPSRPSTTSTTARPSSSAPTASGRRSWTGPPRAASRSSTAPAPGSSRSRSELVKLVEEGYTIVLLGTPKHPEVVGLLGFAPDAIVVDEEDDWERIPHRKKMALISQSTQPPWKFEKLAAFMVARSHELKIVNTVCPVTIRRQQDTLDAAREVDLMVVVGGRSSANTKELTRLCGDRRDARRSRSSPCAISATRPPFEGREDRRRHRRHLDPDRGPPRRRPADPRDRRDARPRGAGRASSPTRRSRSPRRPPVGRPRCRPPRRPARSPWPAQGTGLPGRRDRGPAERRQEHALQPDRRRADGDRRGPGPDDPRPPLRRHGLERPAVRASSTPAASRSRPTTRSRPRSRSRPAWRSPRPTSSSSSSTRSAG